jgi:hypothetical protein
MASALKKHEDERQECESIMEIALRNNGRLPSSIAAEICSDPMAEFMRLRDRRKTR